MSQVTERWQILPNWMAGYFQLSCWNFSQKVRCYVLYERNRCTNVTCLVWQATWWRGTARWWLAKFASNTFDEVRLAFGTEELMQKMWAVTANRPMLNHSVPDSRSIVMLLEVLEGSSMMCLLRTQQADLAPWDKCMLMFELVLMYQSISAAQEWSLRQAHRAQLVLMK